MMTIALIMAVLAVLFVVLSRAMAEDTGITITSNAIQMGGGDPQVIYLTAAEGITPGDNVNYVAGASSVTVEVLDAGDDACIGTADLNDEAVLTGDETPVTHDWATGEMLPIITGNCHVRKIADTAGVNKGNMVRPGSTDGAECQDIGTGANKFVYGRALTSGSDGNPFCCHQF